MKCYVQGDLQFAEALFVLATKRAADLTPHIYHNLMAMYDKAGAVEQAKALLIYFMQQVPNLSLLPFFTSTCPSPHMLMVHVWYMVCKFKSKSRTLYLHSQPSLTFMHARREASC